MRADDAKSHQLPSSMVHEVFGEVNVRRLKAALEVDFTILSTPDLEKSGGYQTGVALDGSKSMKDIFGKTFKGAPPQAILSQWKAKGWISSVVVDGKQVASLSPEAKAEAVENGYFAKCENVVEPIAREFTAYLADGLDEDGGTTVIYWACGKEGRDIEVMGDFDSQECRGISLGGPEKGFGEGTYLKPAVVYFAERFADAANGIYVFLTDGRISDFDEVCQLSIRYATEVAGGTRNPIKFVLIGVGNDIDVAQFEALDDLDAPEDLWDYKIAAELRDLSEIFSEIVDENEILLPPSEIFDDRDRRIVSLSNGVPAKFSFTLPADCKYFELRSQGERIRQVVALSDE